MKWLIVLLMVSMLITPAFARLPIMGYEVVNFEEKRCAFFMGDKDDEILKTELPGWIYWDDVEESKTLPGWKMCQAKNFTNIDPLHQKTFSPQPSWKEKILLFFSTLFTENYP